MKVSARKLSEIEAIQKGTLTAFSLHELAGGRGTRYSGQNTNLLYPTFYEGPKRFGRYSSCFDHLKFWRGRRRKPYMMASEPYLMDNFDLNDGPIADLDRLCEFLGLNLEVSTASEWNPGRTVLLLITKGKRQKIRMPWLSLWELEAKTDYRSDHGINLNAAQARFLLLPYCIQYGEAFGHPGKALLVNRYYQPLGFKSKYPYEELSTDWWVDASLIDEIAQRMPGADKTYLYSDATSITRRSHLNSYRERYLWPMREALGETPVGATEIAATNPKRW